MSLNDKVQKELNTFIKTLEEIGKKKEIDIMEV